MGPFPLPCVPCVPRVPCVSCVPCAVCVVCAVCCVLCAVYRVCAIGRIHPNTSGDILSFPPSLLLAAGCGEHCGAKSTTGVIEIEITDVNEPPSLSTTAANVDKNLDIGTLVKVRRRAHSILYTPFIVVHTPLSLSLSLSLSSWTLEHSCHTVYVNRLFIGVNGLFIKPEDDANTPLNPLSNTGCPSS